MDYQAYFRTRLDDLHDEGNYRVFADLERERGAFPKAVNRDGEAVRDVTIWCSNDYLGMGQHPDVRQAMKDVIDACGTGAGGTRNSG